MRARSLTAGGGNEQFKHTVKRPKSPKTGLTAVTLADIISTIVKDVLNTRSVL